MHCPNCQHENPNEAKFCMKCGTKLDAEAMSSAKVQPAVALSAESRFDVPMTQKLTPLVGREVELTWLLERWNRAKEAEGQVVLLNGEAGIGKSCLVQTLKYLVALDEPAWLAECRCLPDHQNSALYPVIDLLEREVFSFEQEDSPQQKLSKLEEFLDQYGLLLEEEEMAPLFATLLSLPLNEGYTPMDLTPEQQKKKTLQALLKMLLEQAKHQPVLLIVEDLHWVDASTLELLNLLINQIPTARILTIFTFRPTFHPAWSPRSHLTSLTLSRLSSQQVVQIIERITDGVPLPAEVLEQVVTKTDGVPLFVEELTHMVLESGLLEVWEERYELKGGLQRLSIPTTLRDSLMTRLSQLRSMTQEVVPLAAVLGREFSYQLLSAISGLDDEKLLSALQQLVEVEILYQQGIPPQSTYSFKHALIRDAAYESLLKTKRQQYHQRAAEALNEQFPQTAEVDPELLAHHYTEANVVDKAIHYWKQAGIRAVERSGNLEAISHFTRALELIETLAENDPLKKSQIDVLLQQERLYEILGAREQQQVIIDRLAKCLKSDDLSNIAELHIRQGDLYTQIGRFDEAEQALNEALTLRRKLSDAIGESNALRSMGFLRWHQGEYEQALTCNEAALAIDRQLAHVMAVATDLTNLSDVLRNLGDHERALSCLEEALQIYQSEQNRVKQGFTLYQLANVYRDHGEVERAVTHYQQANDIFAQHNDHLMASRAMNALANLFLEQGNLQESLDLYKEVVRISQDVGFGQGLAHARRSLGEILLANNQPTEALSYFLESTEVFSELGESESEAEIWEKVAMIYQQFLRDDPKGYAAWEKVRELRKQINDLRGELEALQQMGQLTRERKDSEAQALGYLYEAKTIADEIGDRAKKGELLNTMGIIEWRQGAYENALSHYEEALVLYRELEDLAREGLMLNSIGVTLRALGRYDEALECLQKAVVTNRQAEQEQFEGYAFAIVGDIYRDQGKHEQALHYYRASLDIRRAIGDRRGEGWMLHALAQGYANLNSLPQARDCRVRALAIAEECADEEMRRACIKLQEQLPEEI